MRIKDIQKEIHKVAKSKGWYKGKKRSIGELIALCHSELSEALEEYREDDSNLQDVLVMVDTNKPVGFAVELADVIIRILDMAEHLGINMEEAIRVKVDYNKTRKERHGGKRI